MSKSTPALDMIALGVVLCSMFIGCNLPETIEKECEHRCRRCELNYTNKHLRDELGKRLTYGEAVTRVHTWMMESKGSKGEFLDGDTYWTVETMKKNLGEERTQQVIQNLKNSKNYD